MRQKFYSDSKYTLVEFWASWCGPCRENNLKWNNLLHTKSHALFRILGVSIDEDLNDWKNAIREDKLTDWAHISDLHGGFKGINALKYGINYVPFNILVDSTGKILKREVSVEELQTYLDN